MATGNEPSFSIPIGHPTDGYPSFDPRFPVKRELAGGAAGNLYGQGKGQGWHCRAGRVFEWKIIPWTWQRPVGAPHACQVPRRVADMGTRVGNPRRGEL